MPKTVTKIAKLAAPRSTGSVPLPAERGEVISKSGVALPRQESRMNQIARRAHHIYEARGGTHGKALEDWLQAEREIDDAMGETEG
jgi:hypothetical protein